MEKLGKLCSSKLIFVGYISQYLINTYVQENFNHVNFGRIFFGKFWEVIIFEFKLFFYPFMIKKGRNDAVVSFDW